MSRLIRACEGGARGRSSGFLLAIGIAVTGIGLVSCRPVWSVYHLGTPADTSFDARSEGHWVRGNFLPDSTGVTRAEFDPVRGSRLSRRTRLPDGRWRYEEWDFRLVHLGGRWFADLPPLTQGGGAHPPLRPAQLEKLARAAPPVGSARYDRFLQIHFRLILRVDVEADTLTLRCIDDDALEHFAGSHARRFGLAGFPDAGYYTYILTDSTSRLRAFVQDIANVDSLFRSEQRLVRAH